MKLILAAFLLCSAVAHAGEAPSFSDPNYLVGGKVVKLDATDGDLAPGPLTLDPGAVSDGPIAYQWLRDGKALPGETSPKLALATITKADAGEYSVRISNRYGKATSGKYDLVVVGKKTSDFVSFGDKQTKNVQVRNVWGPASFVWSSDGRPDSALGHGPSATVYRGSLNRWTLTAGVVVAVPGYQTDPVEAAEFTIGSIPDALFIGLEPNLWVGQPVNAQIAVFSDLADGEVSLKWLNAPPGLKLVPPSEQSYGMWTVKGTLTNPGFFHSTLVLHNKSGTSRLDNGYVVKPSAPIPGVNTDAQWFEGILNVGDNPGVSFRVALTSHLTFSGVLSLGGKRVPFSGQLGPSSVLFGYDVSLPVPAAGVGFSLRVILSDSGLTLTLTRADGSLVATGGTYGSSWSTHSMPASWAGHYHALLRSTNIDVFSLATLDISPSGRATFVATLSDGTVVSHHGVISDVGMLNIYHSLYRNGAGSFAGQVVVNTYSQFTWSRPPATQLGIKDATPTMFRSGLKATISSNNWSRYRPARSFEPFLGLPDGKDNAELETTFTQPLSLPRRVTIARDGSVTAPAGYRFQLGIDPVTGYASGRVGVSSVNGKGMDSVPLKGLVVGAHAGAPSAQVFVMGTATVPTLLPEFPRALAPVLISSVAATPDPAPYLMISSEADQILRSSVTVVEGHSAHLLAGPAVQKGDIVRWRATETVGDELNSENFVVDPDGNLEWLHCDSMFEGAIIQAIVVGTGQLVAEYRIHVVSAFKLAIDPMTFDQQAPTHVVLPVNAVQNQLSAKGLPPGLRLSREMIDDGSGTGMLVKTWVLVGAPTQEGRWVATFAMRNAAGVSTQQVPITVVPVLIWDATGVYPNPEGMTGMYTGNVYPGALLTEPGMSMPQGGRIVVNVTRTGSFTGVLETIGSKQSFTGVLDGFDFASGQPSQRSGHVKLAPLPGIAHPVLTVFPGRGCDITDSEIKGIGTWASLSRAMPVVPQIIHGLLQTQGFDTSPPALVVATSSGGPNINMVIRQGGKAITFSTLGANEFWAVSPSSPSTALTGQLVDGYGVLTSITTVTDDTGTSYPYSTLQGDGSLWTPPLPGNLLLDLPRGIDNAQLDTTPITLSPGLYNYAFKGLPSDDGPANWQITIDRKTGTFTATRTTTATLHYFGLFFPGLHKAVGIDWHPPDTISDSPVLMEIKPAE